MMRNPSTWPSPSSSGDALTVRPQIPWASVLTFGVLFGGGMIVLSLIFSALRPADRLIIVACAVALDMCLVIAGIRLYLIGRFARLRIDGDSLIFISSLGRRRIIPRHSFGQIVRATLDVDLVRSSFTVSYYLFLDPRRRSLLKLSRKWWPDAEIGRVGRELGLPVTGDFLDVIGGPAFRQKFPGAISWPAAHPRVCLLLAFVLGLPAIVVVGTFLMSPR